MRTFGISLDDVQAQRAFAIKEKLDFPLLSDPDGSVAGKYGVLAPGGRFAQRVTFVVDPKGVVRFVDRSVDVGSHGSDLAKTIAELQKQEPAPKEEGGDDDHEATGGKRGTTEAPPRRQSAKMP